MSVLETMMDLSTFSDDGLADLFGDLIREAEARVARVKPDRRRHRVRAALAVIHIALSAAREDLVKEQVIQPFSGGDPK